MGGKVSGVVVLIETLAHAHQDAHAHAQYKPLSIIIRTLPGQCHHAATHVRPRTYSPRLDAVYAPPRPTPPRPERRDPPSRLTKARTEAGVG